MRSNGSRERTGLSYRHRFGSRGMTVRAVGSPVLKVRTCCSRRGGSSRWRVGPGGSRTHRWGTSPFFIKSGRFVKTRRFVPSRRRIGDELFVCRQPFTVTWTPRTFFQRDHVCSVCAEQLRPLRQVVPVAANRTRRERRVSIASVGSVSDSI